VFNLSPNQIWQSVSSTTTTHWKCTFHPGTSKPYPEVKNRPRPCHPVIFKSSTWTTLIISSSMFEEPLTLCQTKLQLNIHVIKSWWRRKSGVIFIHPCFNRITLSFLNISISIARGYWGHNFFFSKSNSGLKGRAYFWKSDRAKKAKEPIREKTWQDGALISQRPFIYLLQSPSLPFLSALVSLQTNKSSDSQTKFRFSPRNKFSLLFIFFWELLITCQNIWGTSKYVRAISFSLSRTDVNYYSECECEYIGTRT